MAFFLAVLFVVGLGVELFSLLDGLRHIRFSYELPAELVEQGAEVPIGLQVYNHSILPVTYLRAEVNFPAAAVLPDELTTQKEDFLQSLLMIFRIWGRRGVKRTVPIRLETRGVHYFRGAVLEKTDFAGVHNVIDEFKHDTHILVYPKCLESQSLLSAMGEYCGDMIAQRHLLRDPIITLGVREYTGREPMKTISWTQSARRGQLVVREFDFTRDLTCTVLLATDGMMPTRIAQFDQCCSIARTVCRELTDRGVNVDFYTNSPIETMGRQKKVGWNCTVTAEDQNDLLECLALLYPGPVSNSADVMAVGAARAAGQNTAFVVVAPNNNESVSRAVSLLEEYSGMRVLLLLASDFTDESGERS